MDTMHDDARRRARELVLQHGWNPTAYQILNRGIRLWFSAAGDAVAGFARHGRTWVVAGAPVCAAERLDGVARELEETAAAERCAVLYFGAGERLERLLVARGAHHLLRLGALPIWSARDWPRTIARHASLRAQVNRARNKGVRVEEWPTPPEPGRRDALERVLTCWLRTRGLPPLHFMTEAKMLSDLRDRRLFVATRGGDVVGYLVATPVPARGGWLIEQWPRAAEAPNGTTHRLVDAAMQSLAVQSTFVSLGLAPLSDRAGDVGDGEPLWVRALLRWMRAHGKRFYNFAGLDAFKASLDPERWEPVFLAVPGSRLRPGHLYALAGVFGGGSPALLVARALAMSLRRELREWRFK